MIFGYILEEKNRRIEEQISKSRLFIPIKSTLSLPIISFSVSFYYRSRNSINFVLAKFLHIHMWWIIRQALRVLLLSLSLSHMKAIQILVGDVGKGVNTNTSNELTYSGVDSQVYRQ